MDCGQIAEYLSPLADNELEPEIAEKVRAHLNGCPHCETLLQNHVKIKQLLPRLLPFQKTPAGLRSTILERLDASPVNDFVHAFFSRLRAQPFVASGVAVTAFLTVFAFAVVFMNSHRLPPLIREVMAYHAEASQHLLRIPPDPNRLTKVISERFNRDIVVPDLSKSDCTLRGWEECPVCERSAVEVHYGHPKANVCLFVVPDVSEDDFVELCKPGTLGAKQINGKTYYYCETRACRAIVWWEDDFIVLMTSCLPLPDPFETATAVRERPGRRGI
jgi:anti-sigma factor (TIGR02949 family)